MESNSKQVLICLDINYISSSLSYFKTGSQVTQAGLELLR